MDLSAYIVGAGALIAFVAGFIMRIIHKANKNAERKIEDEIRRDSEKRTAAARDALREGRDSGLSPVDRVRRNDGDWSGV